jgi:hypothetical protein
MRVRVWSSGLLLACALTLGACGGSGGGGGSLSIKTPDGQTQEVELKSGAFLTEQVGRHPVGQGFEDVDATKYNVCVANYDMSLAPGSSTMSLEAPVKEGQVKVCFVINGNKGYNENMQLNPIKYPAARLFEPYQTNSMGAASIRTFKDGKEQINYLTGNRKGEIEITSVEGNTVSGKLNLADDKSEIKGTFSAEKIKKS